MNDDGESKVVEIECDERDEFEFEHKLKQCSVQVSFINKIKIVILKIILFFFFWYYNDYIGYFISIKRLKKLKLKKKIHFLNISLWNQTFPMKIKKFQLF